MAPGRCVILVPYSGGIEPACEQGLDELERRGYAVRRAPGFSQIDVGRCALASVALADSFDELLWIDSDIAFHPDDVERLRGHDEPFVCGLYAKKSRRELACTLLPGTDKVTLGAAGGLCEVRYVGFGFTLTRRVVYETMQARLQLPECNQRFGERFVPYFQPLVVPDGAGQWYLGEDYAFCERARRCGFRVMADTRIRLWHLGSYPFSWEDAGSPKERYTTYTFRHGGGPASASGAAGDKP